MKILLASSEVHPYSKTGGLADMAAALGKFLGKAGHRVGIVTPLYRGIRERHPGITKFDWQLDLSLGLDRIRAEVYTLEASKGVTVYFIHQPAYFDRTSIYNEHGVDYPDNAQRYLFFSKCAVNLARYLPWRPEMVHVHDWQTGLVPLLIKHQANFGYWKNPPKTCYTIHNLAYQGNFPPSLYPLTNLPWDYYDPDGAEFYGQFSLMKTGIVYADVLTTVSPRYAIEITTPEFGCGLDGVLRARRDSLFGVLNGVDYEEWNTEHNRFLKHSFSVRNLAGKTAEKLDLQRELGLPENNRVPLFACISRLADQKGMDLLLGALNEMLAADMQFVLLGTGRADYQNGFLDLARRFSSQVAVRIDFNAGLAHRLEAGSDFFIMPSRFEPCGLNQMYSLRYGSIPIVRVTGGLDDTVNDISTEEADFTGIKFSEYSMRALAKAIRKALVLYQNPDLLAEFRKNAMRADFSWERTARQYLKVYRDILKR